MSITCYLCDGKADLVDSHFGMGQEISCTHCGEYIITNPAITHISKKAFLPQFKIMLIQRLRDFSFPKIVFINNELKVIESNTRGIKFEKRNQRHPYGQGGNT